MDLTNQQIKDTYGNLLTIGTTAGSPTTGTLQNGEGLNITSFRLYGDILIGSGTNGRLTAAGDDLYLKASGDFEPQIALIKGTGKFGFTRSGATTGVSLFIDNNHILAQRDSTNAQTFNIYNTYTDGSNYERGFLKWNSNVLEIGTEKLGTGSARGLLLDSGGRVASINIGGTYNTVAVTGVLTTSSSFTVGTYMEASEITAPSAPAANKVRIYAEDNGSGKTKLMALFPTGAAQQIAIEP